MKLHRKSARILIWALLFFFLGSMEGVPVLAQEILDSPDTQGGSLTTGSGSDPAAGTGSGAPATTTPPEGSGDQVTLEKLNIPAGDGELVMVENPDAYNIPALELKADDGRQGPCGPFSMTSALKGRGAKITYGEVMKTLKPQDCFTVPGEMVDFALSKGFGCRRNDGESVEGILNYIKTTKRSIIVMVHTADLEKQADGSFKQTSKDGIQHWLNIIGVRVKDNKPVSVLMKDSCWSHSSGSVNEMPADEFDFRWKEMVGLFAIALDPHRLTLKIDGAGTANFGDRLAQYFHYYDAGEMLAEGIATSYKALGALWQGIKTGNFADFNNAVVHLASSVVKLAAGIVGTVVLKLGEGAEYLGDLLSREAMDLWQKGGVLGKIAAVPILLLGGALQLVGGVLKVVGNFVASVAATIGNVINSISDAITKFLKKIWDAVNPANWF